MDDSVVLVVEDDTNLRDLMQALLEDLFGVASIPAGNGKDALRLAKEKHPSLILLDIRLPGMDGLEVARRLRADPSTQDIPIIAVTATTTRENALDAGCADMIPKPFDVSYFKSLVQLHLAKEVDFVAL